MANAEGSSTSSMTFPLSLTDFVKALRELVGLVKDTGQLIGDGAQLYDRRRCKKAAERLYVLSFTPQGMRSPLKRIAAGQGTGEDFGLIERLLLESASRVEENLGKLLAFKDRLREQVSWEAANVLDEIISGPVGKQVTRQRLARIVGLSKADPPPLDEIRSIAQQVDTDIEQLNEKLKWLHDLVLVAGK